MKFLVLRRTDAASGKVEYCTHAGYHWSDDICHAKEYSKVGSIKSLVATAKQVHQNELRYQQNGNKYYNYYIPLQYIYHIVPVEKIITEDHANTVLVP